MASFIVQRNALQLSLAAFMASMLGACVHATGTVDRTSSVAVSQQASLTDVTTQPRKRSRSARRQRTEQARVRSDQVSSDGVASFYRHGSRTASGEKFNPSELTAAHRTLPFGTRVRVTNVNNGESVTVRVNDRGPFIKGRVIDVSHAAAESLGMVGRGVAKVKLDVVE
jgi:rare lipoprotein A